MSMSQAVEHLWSRSLQVHSVSRAVDSQEPRCLVQGYVLAELHAQLPSLLGEGGEGRRSGGPAVSGWTLFVSALM